MNRTRQTAEANEITRAGPRLRIPYALPTPCYVLFAYLAIQVEINIITPFVMKKGLDVPPVVTILAGSVMAILSDFLGLLVAVPLAAAVMVVVKTT